MKKILFLLTSLLLVFVMVSCGNGDNTTQNQTTENGTANESGTANGNGTITVIMDIDFPDDSGVSDVDDAKITVNDGSTVLDVLNTYADTNNIEILTDESSKNPYITSINGVVATEAAGWVYEVNDEKIMESANKYTVKNNDKIDWDFESWIDDTNK